MHHEPLPELQYLLSSVHVSAWRLFLHTPSVHATTPMIRGVWGRALRRVDRNLYDHIFAGLHSNGHNLPRYILRPAPPETHKGPAVDWILFDVDQHHRQTLWKSWHMTCAMGLGANREPFRILRRAPLTPDHRLTDWNLGDVPWPLSGDPAFTPCHLKFDVPVRLIKKSRLITSPEFGDVITSALRRIAGLAGIPRSTAYANLSRTVRAIANQRSDKLWVGEKCNLIRWSAAQQREVELFGVTGTISLSHGPGSVWPLLAAAQWCHLGKGTVFGMGQFRILPAPT